jgi:L-glutamine-phosphate cytidylyltransferase
MTKLILLAAGRGVRMGSLTESLPKCLTIIHGRPIIQHILDLAKSCGISTSDTIVVGGYRSEKLRNLETPLLINNEWATTGPVYTWSKASYYLSRFECITSYTDIIYSVEFLVSSLSSSQDIFIPSNSNFLDSWGNRQLEMLSDLETFKMKHGKVIEIGNKPNTIEEVEGQFAGIIKTKPSGWDKLSQVINTNLDSKLDMTNLLKKTIEQGYDVYGEQISGKWWEFDLPSDVKNSQH